MPVSIRDIAERLDLSYQTVANILSSSPARRAKHSPQTQQRVLDAADRWGYRPNRAALAVKTGRFSSVALILSSDSNKSYLPQDLIDGMLTGLQQRQLGLSVARLRPEAADDPAMLPRYLTERACDGLLVDLTHSTPPAIAELIDRSDLPAVWINNLRPTNAVYPADRAAGRAAAELLTAAGHREILYLQLYHGDRRTLTPDIHYSVADRQRGVEDALKAAGCYRRAAFPDVRLEPAQMMEAARELLARVRPTGVVTYSISETVATTLAATQLGIRMPRDLSIVSLADDSARIGLPITTVSADRKELGLQAVRMLVDRINGAGDRRSVAVPPQVIEGPSIAPPRAAG